MGNDITAATATTIPLWLAEEETIGSYLPLCNHFVSLVPSYLLPDLTVNRISLQEVRLTVPKRAVEPYSLGFDYYEFGGTVFIEYQSVDFRHGKASNKASNDVVDNIYLRNILQKENHSLCLYLVHENCSCGNSICHKSLKGSSFRLYFKHHTFVELPYIHLRVK
jgi:hypothetical protein